MKLFAASEPWQQGSVRWKIAFVFLMLLPVMMVATVVGMEICVAVIGLMLLWDSGAKRQWAWARTPFFRVALVAWLWLVLVVSPFALKPHDSVALALPWIRYALLVMALRYWLLTTPQSIRLFIIACSVVVAWCGMDMAWQYIHGTSIEGYGVGTDYRLTGPFHGPKAGYFMAKMFVPLLAAGSVFFLYTLQHAKPTMTHTLLAQLITTTVLALIFLSGGRVAFMASMLTILLVYGAVAFSSRQARRYLVALPILVISMFALLLSTQDQAQSILGRTTAQVENYSASTYGVVLRTGFEVGRDYWQTGVGMHGFREITETKYEAAQHKDLSAFPERYMHPHNTYMEWFAEAGLLGLVFCITLVGILLQAAWREFRQSTGAAYVFPAAMLAACIMNFFPFMTTMSYFNNWAGVLTWFSMGFVYSLPALKPLLEPTQRPE